MTRLLPLALVAWACGTGGEPGDPATPPSPDTAAATDTAGSGSDDTASGTSAADTGSGSTESTALVELSVGDVALQPAFDPDQRYYAVRAAELPATVVVDATAAAAGATVDIVHQTMDGARIDQQAPGASFTVGPDERLVVEVTVGSETHRYGVFLLPDDLPEITVEVTDDATEGFTFLANFDFVDQPPDVGRYALIVDPAGVPVWWRHHALPSFDLRISEGQLTYLGTEPEATGMEGLVVDPRTGETTARFVPAPPAVGQLLGTDPHELFTLPDGSAVIIGNVLRTRDLSPWGGAVDGQVIDQVVQQLDPGGEVVFEWSTAEVDIDQLPATLQALVPNAPELEVAHANSVEIDPHDGHWVISMRLLSQVVKIARSETTFRGETVAPGERLWTLGGPHSDFVFVDDERDGGWQGFSEQHSARVLADGNLLLFDNGTSFDLGQTGPARAVEYELDTEAMIATRVWDHELADGGPTPAAGSVQRLAGGHTLIGWGSTQHLPDGRHAPALSEVDPDGGVVRELWLPDGQWTYRAWHFDGDPLTGDW